MGGFTTLDPVIVQSVAAAALKEGESSVPLTTAPAPHCGARPNIDAPSWGFRFSVLLQPAGKLKEIKSLQSRHGRCIEATSFAHSRTGEIV